MVEPILTIYMVQSSKEREREREREKTSKASVI